MSCYSVRQVFNSLGVGRGVSVPDYVSLAEPCCPASWESVGSDLYLLVAATFGVRTTAAFFPLPLARTEALVCLPLEYQSTAMVCPTSGSQKGRLLHAVCESRVGGPLAFLAGPGFSLDSLNSFILTLLEYLHGGQPNSSPWGLAPKLEPQHPLK